ncbi:MAG: F0F1 ATP synthase subunit A, partial [Acidimicrobiales bacterium]
MQLAAKTIEVGVHPHLHFLGLTIDSDILMSTIAAVAIFLFLGFRMRSKVTSGVPGKLQLFWELLVEQVRELADSAVGPQGRRFVPIGVTVFLFIL